MITIMIYRNDKLCNVLTKTLFEYAKWFERINEKYDIQCVNNLSSSCELIRDNNTRYIVMENIYSNGE